MIGRSLRLIIGMSRGWIMLIRGIIRRVRRRFMSSDPAGYSDPSESASWNQYSYVQSDPINYIDHAGEFRIPVLSGIGSFFGSLFGIIGRAAPIPIPTVVRFSPAERQRVHKDTTDRWVNNLAIAVATATQRNEESERPMRYPKYLARVPGSDRCYRVGNGPIQRNITTSYMTTKDSLCRAPS